jgi:hypothetical protein
MGRDMQTQYADIRQTPATLRARIKIREDALKQADPDAWIWWRLNQTIADLERQLAEKEDGR